MTHHEVPTCITPDHRRRSVVLYVRTAIIPEDSRVRCQLQDQRAQEEHAYRWGWTSDRVLVNDEDIGRSGAAADRPGFQKLRSMIAQGRVGLVLVSDLGRLSRSNVSLLAFLTLCQQHGTLVAANGHLIDLAHPPGNYPERLHGLVGQFYADLTRLFAEVDALHDEMD